MLYMPSLRRLALLFAGPFGCFVLYNFAFIWRAYAAEDYEHLARYYEWPGVGVLASVYVGALAISAWATFKFTPFTAPIVSPSLSKTALSLIVLTTAALMAFTVYRVFGTLSPAVVMDEYARYFRYSRIGGAWVILAGYGLLYIFLIDMYFGGVNRWNSSALLVSVTLNFVTGGRMILTCVLLAYLFLLYLQRPRYRDLFLGMGAAIAVAVLSFVAVTEMRMPTEDEVQVQESGVPATESHRHLNYNSAFVLDDVIGRLKDGSLSLAPHFIADLALLVPRAIWPDKPKATSDTRAVYPHVAERGTTMSFPLAANVVMHVGLWAFFLTPLVTALCHVLFVWGVSRRIGLVSFLAFFWGAMFVHIARSGVFDYRLILHTAMIAVLFLGYRIAMRGWLGNWPFAAETRPIPP